MSDKPRAKLTALRALPGGRAGKPRTMTLNVLLVFTVDGKPVGQAPLRLENVEVPAPGVAGTINVNVNGRAVAAMLAPHVGPAQEASKLWTPGQGPAPVLKRGH